LKAGFRWALAVGYDAVLILDADGHHDPAEIQNFLEVYRANGDDLIIGQRNFSHIPPIRTIYAGENSHIDPWSHTKNYFRMLWKSRQG
jgi:hypothetical protein